MSLYFALFQVKYTQRIKVCWANQIDETRRTVVAEEIKSMIGEKKRWIYFKKQNNSIIILSRL